MDQVKIEQLLKSLSLTVLSIGESVDSIVSDSDSIYCPFCNSRVSGDYARPHDEKCFQRQKFTIQEILESLELEISDART